MSPHPDSVGSTSGRLAVRRFVDNWVGIVLTVVSIIQGLAVSRLADSYDRVHSLEKWCAFTLAFVVILRVFQTYVAAALEYDEWQISFVDLVVIFGCKNLLKIEAMF